MATASNQDVGGRPRTLTRSELGRRIETLAARRGMTLEQLAVAGGLRLSTLYRITTGDTPDPRVSTVQAIAEALGITMDRLICQPRRSSRRSIA